MILLNYLEDSLDEEVAERAIPVIRSVEHAFAGLAVMAVVIGSVGQWDDLGDGKID
jgi:hypothetical protein